VDVTGVGGNVTIKGVSDNAGSLADSVDLSNGSRIVSEANNGDGGRVAIAATSVNATGQDAFGQVSTINSFTFGTGGGGDIVLSVQRASFSEGATIASDTFLGDAAAGQAEGANIIVQGLDGDGSKADSLTLKDFRSGMIIDSHGSGRSGAIEVHAKTVSLTEGAVIEGGNPFGDGTGGNVTIHADSVGIVGGSHISSQARSQDAGQVTIMADQLILDNGSIVTTTISETGGRGGDVVIDVETVSLSNQSTINSSTSQTGRAGDITMTVGALSLADGSSISSASTGTVPVTNFGDGTTEPPGTAGNVAITATGSFTGDASTVATSAEANHGGDISIAANSVQFSNGTVITASSKAPLVVTKLVLDQDGLPVEVEAVGDDGRSDGNAGNVTITSASNVIMQNSSVTTEASQASGGQITINAADSGMVQLINSKVITSVAGSSTDTAGGDILIDPQFVILQNSQVLAQAFAGTGGNISIISNVFLQDPNSLVDASSQLGISGTVNIQSPLQNIGEELTALTQEFASAAALLAQQCAARVADGKFSTFVVAAREGLPAEPGGFLASPSLTPELLGSRLSGRHPQTQLPAVTGLFPKYDARPIQLAKLGSACHR
jgi:large exoprotein involved in heme utilization and adhesion